MISLNDYKNSKSVKSLVQKMFESRQVAHIHHLQSKSYSQHKDLNGFYDGILDNINEKDTQHKNIMDEVVALTYRTIYKIKYLK